MVTYFIIGLAARVQNRASADGMPALPLACLLCLGMLRIICVVRPSCCHRHDVLSSSSLPPAGMPAVLKVSHRVHHAAKLRTGRPRSRPYAPAAFRCGMSMTLALAHVSAPPEEQSGEKKRRPQIAGMLFP